MGAPLTVVYSTECAAPRSAARQVAILPLLVILFLVSYGILAALVFEQGKTIESQRSLIREMLKDSTQLAALKGKIARDDSKRVQDKAPDQAAHNDASSVNADPDPAAGTRKSGAKELNKEYKRPGKSAHTMKAVPQKPAADLEDVRRSTGVI
jgi:hypothetical protein